MIGEDLATLERLWALPAFTPPPPPPSFTPPPPPPSFTPPPPPCVGEQLWPRLEPAVREWLTVNAVTRYTDGTVLLFKCVGRDYKSAHGVRYPLGEWVEMPDGLYVSARQEDALAHVSRFGRRRMLWVRVGIDELEPLHRGGVLALDKIRCRRLFVEQELR